jgi:hypothetical protein
MTNAKIEMLTKLMVIEGCAGLVVVLIILAMLYFVLYA